MQNSGNFDLTFLSETCYVAFNSIIHQVFSETFIEISQIFQKIQRLYSSILAIFINFLDFLTLPCYLKAN